MTRWPFLALVAGSLIVAVAISMLWPMNAFAASCPGQWMRASWYGAESGNRTANGEPFNGTSLTVAHRSLPFGTKLRVSYRGKSVVVRVNDRGPAKWTGRDIDLSRAVAARIGMLGAGVETICVQRL